MSNITPKVDRPKFSGLKRFRSIRYTIPLIIITPLVTAVTAIGWLTFQRGQQQIDDLISQICDKSTAAIESKVESYLASHNAFLSMQIAAIENGNLNLNNFSGLESYFWQQLKKQQGQENSIWKVYLGNERGDYLGVERDGKQYVTKVRDRFTQGTRYFYTYDDRGNSSPKKPTLEKYNSVSRPWYQAARKTGKLAWTDIYGITNSDGSDRNLGITLAVPIFEQRTGNLEGVLATDLTLPNISQFLHELSISPTGRVLLIDRKGNLVASSTNEDLLQENNREPINVSQSSDSLVKATSQNILDKFRDFRQIQGKVSVIFTINGQQQFVQIRPILGSQQPDWLMVAIIPKADFMQPIYDNIKYSIIVDLLGIGIAVIIALITVRWITKPIERLHQAAQGIQSEKFDSQNLEIMTKRPDEFGELAKVFLGMMQVIYGREQNWKQLVDKLQAENYDPANQKNLAIKNRQALYLEQLLKKARSLRTDSSQTSHNNSKDY